MTPEEEFAFLQITVLTLLGLVCLGLLYHYPPDPNSIEILTLH